VRRMWIWAAGSDAEHKVRGLAIVSRVGVSGEVPTTLFAGVGVWGLLNLGSLSVF
jgi:hypothetical protein